MFGALHTVCTISIVIITQTLDEIFFKEIFFKKIVTEKYGSVTSVQVHITAYIFEPKTENLVFFIHGQNRPSQLRIFAMSGWKLLSLAETLMRYWTSSRTLKLMACSFSVGL